MKGTRNCKHINWDNDLLNLLFEASGLKSRDFFKKMILRLAEDLEISL